MAFAGVAQRAHDRMGIREALYQVVLRAEAQRAHREFLVLLRCHCDDRHGGRGDPRARERGEPLPFFEREIEQDGMEALVAQPPQAVLDAARLCHLERRLARRLEQRA